MAKANGERVMGLSANEERELVEITAYQSGPKMPYLAGENFECDREMWDRMLSHDETRIENERLRSEWLASATQGNQ